MFLAICSIRIKRTHINFFHRIGRIFLTRVKKLFFFLLFFLAEQAENEFEGLKNEWFEPDVSTKLVDSLLLPFFFLLGMLTLLPSKGSSALPLWFLKWWNLGLCLQAPWISLQEFIILLFFPCFSFIVWHLSFMHEVQCEAPKVFITLTGLPCQIVSWSAIFCICFGIGSLSNCLAKWWAQASKILHH